MKRSALLSFFLIAPLFSCAKITYYNVSVTNTNCNYILEAEQVPNNVDYHITFTPDFGRNIYKDDETCLLVKVGGIPYYYDIYQKDKPWTFADNVLTIKARIIDGDIEVVAYADIASEEYKITYDCGVYTKSSCNYDSGDYIQIDGQDFRLVFSDPAPSSRENFIITPSDSRFDSSVCVYQDNTFTIPKSQLGCNIHIDVKL